MTNDKLADLIVEMTLPPALKVAMGLAGPPPAGGLFHFTSTEGLVGIVTSKSLRASLSSSLNDASEGTYARDLAIEVAAAGVEGIETALCEATHRVLRNDPSVQTALTKPPMRVYLSSFCDSTASSLQWLHYGKLGMGIALEFEGTKIAASPFDLLRICYDPAEQRRLVHYRGDRRSERHVVGVEHPWRRRRNRALGWSVRCLNSLRCFRYH